MPPGLWTVDFEQDGYNGEYLDPDEVATLDDTEDEEESED